jgi:argininosuccinate synthase
MTNRTVVACFGDAHSSATIEQLAATGDVVAVAFDFGGPTTLSVMRDAALAAGALRCHALDVREEFARECLLPALIARAYADPAAARADLAPMFVARKLDEIAHLERASVRLPDVVCVSTRPLSRPIAVPLHLHIEFADGVPVSVNGVPMTIAELMESVETITGEPALAVLDREITKSRDHQLV